MSPSPPLPKERSQASEGKCCSMRPTRMQGFVALQYFSTTNFKFSSTLLPLISPCTRRATVRFTKALYASSEDAQQAAAVLGLFLVAGDRRMDRVLATEFVPLWKEAEEEDALRKKKDAEREKWRREQEEREVLS